MDLCYCNKLCSAGPLAGQSSNLHDRKLNIGHYMQTCEPNLFIPAMLIGTIDFCHFIPFSLNLTLPGGHKVKAKQNL